MYVNVHTFLYIYKLLINFMDDEYLLNSVSKV